MELGDRIRDKRRQVNLTQSQLAEAIGVTEQSVSKWETGQRAPDILLLPKLAKLLSTSVDFLLTGEENIKYVALSPYDLCRTDTQVIRQRQNIVSVTYNGITPNANFPPRNLDKIENYERLPVPYLRRGPKVIDISIGRQLFVDDFLIEKSSFARQYHTPRRYYKNPIFFPETELELGRGGHVSMAAPFSDGLWYDGRDKKYKLWYHAGWFDGTAYAESDDGISFTRPDLGDDLNRCIPARDGVQRDSCAVVLNRYYDEERPYKMFLYSRPVGGEIYDSADGRSWRLLGGTGEIGDRSTIFYNPFRKKWVYSMRTDFGQLYKGVRARSYVEADTLEEGAPLTGHCYWTRADRYDPVEPTIGDKPTLYNLDCVAYESIILGAFDIFLGPENNFCAATGIPKHTELHLGYSRDGFHFYRPEPRQAFLAPDRANPDSWERGYIHSNNGICIIDGNELKFYYTAFRGDPTRTYLPAASNGMYANASMGLATLRRDGFASLNANGFTAVLTTKPLWFRGDYLFVNGNFKNGSLRAALLDEDGSEIPGFGIEDSVRMNEDSTRVQLRWQNHSSLSELSGSVIRLKFEGINGQLYAFWITDSETGASHGALAAGEVGKESLWDE